MSPSTQRWLDQSIANWGKVTLFLVSNCALFLDKNFSIILWLPAGFFVYIPECSFLALLFIYFSQFWHPFWQLFDILFDYFLFVFAAFWYRFDNLPLTFLSVFLTNCDHFSLIFPSISFFYWFYEGFEKVYQFLTVHSPRRDYFSFLAAFAPPPPQTFFCG